MLSNHFVENIDLLHENLIPIERAGKCFPVKVSRATLERFCRKGVRGAKLETVAIGNRRFCSIEGISRFLKAQNNPSQSQPANPGEKQTGRGVQSNGTRRRV